MVSRFIEEDSRSQATLFPEKLDDFIAHDNPIRAIDTFVEGRDLGSIGFASATPKQTGRPAYRPTSLLKLYIYGYMNRIQSSRRLEREAHRNVELMWLLGRLQPDFKTIANFHKDNGPAIQQCCREFVEICRLCEFFTKLVVAIDGSKFKAVNSKQKNDTQGSLKRRIKRTEQHIAKYLAALDDKDDDDPGGSDQSEPELKEKLASLHEQLEQLKEREKLVKAHPDKQLSETDPDSRLMKQSTVGSLVGYNVQNVVDAEYKLIVAHEVTNKPTDRSQLLPMAKLAKETLRPEGKLTVLADRGYYKGTDIYDCVEDNMITLVPKSKTSPTGAAGFYPREDFKYESDNDVYRCPAGEPLKYRSSYIDDGKVMKTYFASNPVCQACRLKTKCTKGVHRRVHRWEHEEVLEDAQQKLDDMPDAMTIRAETVEHPFGTLKLWMGARHFLMKRLENVKTEMNLHVLSYNLRRMISILGVPALIEMVS